MLKYCLYSLKQISKENSCAKSFAHHKKPANPIQPFSSLMRNFLSGTKDKQPEQQIPMF
jgi:hypothetical protein